MSFTAVLLLSIPFQHDAARANGYDDAWEAAWVAHAQAVLAGGTKTPGFVLQVGDSITHSNPYSQWPRTPNGASATDAALLNRISASLGFPISNPADPSIKNGFYLAAADTSGGRGMSAASGLSASEFLSGNGNGGAAMPAETVPATARSTVSTLVTDNLHVTTVAAAFEDAQFAVLMLGTNDVGAGRSAAAFIADLGAIVDAFEARKTAVILSTIPPHHANDALAQQFNTQIRALARTRALPLIDFHAEILARRPGSSWNGTLLGLNDVHPSASGGGFSSNSDPYAAGGSSAEHRTGSSCDEVGYLLRSWLTVQKLKEVIGYAVDGSPLPSPPPSTPAPGPSVASGGGGDGDDDSCSCGAAGAGKAGPLGFLLLWLLLIRRR
jgi:uncharacterized protein (TIGR03382 family)